MALPPQRNMNGNLASGMSDGGFVELNRDRGGFVETTTEEARSLLYPINYDYIEAPTKTLPDGTIRHGGGVIKYRSQIRHEG